MYSFRVMRGKLLAGLTIGLLAMVFAPARASTVSVSIKSGGGNEFHPQIIRVQVGDTVTWSNDDRTLFQTPNTRHTATANDGSFDSGKLKEGDSYTFTFTKAGYIPYQCTVQAGMTGAVVVVAPQATHRPTPTPTPSTTRSVKPRASKSPSPTPTATGASPSPAASIKASSVGSNGATDGRIIAVAIAAITILLLLGYFVYVKFLRQDY